MTHRGTKDVLELCETVELACAKLYHHLADLFKGDRDYLLLWVKAAMEEENHARLFALVRKLRQNDIIESVEIDLVQAKATLLYVRSLIRKVKRRPPSMEGALLIAIDLETRIDGFLVKNIIKFADQSFEKLFQEITATDQRHLQALREAYVRVTAVEPQPPPL